MPDLLHVAWQRCGLSNLTRIQACMTMAEFEVGHLGDFALATDAGPKLGQVAASRRKVTAKSG